MSISKITPNSIAGLEYGFKNRIINGAMTVDQRGTASSPVSPTTSNIYTLDRWKADKISNAAYTVQQVTDAPAGFANSLKVTITTGAAPTASSYNRLIQCIEGFNTYDLGFGTGVAQNVSVSFWVKASIAGLYPVGLQNNATNRSYTATFTVNSANTWEYKTVTIPVDTTGTWVGATNGIGLLVLFDLGSDSAWNQTAGSWAGTNTWRTSGTVTLAATTNATFQITGVQLEKGSTATSFDYRPYGTELALCQRYYWQLGPGFAYLNLGSFTWEGANNAQCIRTPPVTMRTNPTFSKTGNLSLLNGVLGSLTIDSNQSAPGSLNIALTSATGGTSGSSSWIRGNNDATVSYKFDAEL